jgi:hypothetical protein
MDARHDVGELPRAWQAWQQALAIFEEIRHADAEQVRAKLDRCSPLPPGRGAVASDCDDGSVVGA